MDKSQSQTTSLYQNLIDAGIEERDIEQRIGEGWTLQTIYQQAVADGVVMGATPEYETASGARLDEIAAEFGIRVRRCLREDHQDGFGAIWETDLCLRDRISAKCARDNWSAETHG
jgi:hypothetical protein